MDLLRRAFRLSLGSRLPTTEGVIEVEGVDRPVAIRRDRFGIPHITAENDVIALDGKMDFDDNALYRHPDLADMRERLRTTKAGRSVLKRRRQKGRKRLSA